ncbi:unnamed protein product [Closterium sp. NIES-53]
MHSRLLVSGLPRSLPPLLPSPTPPCLPCVEGRQHATPHSFSFPPMTAPLQTLHMDVWGPCRVSGQDRERYFLLVVDDYTHYTTVFPLRSKGESFTLPASPQQNGVAERRIGLVMEVARISMIHAAAPHFLWPFADWYAAHQLNLWPRSRAFVRDTSADKLSSHAIPCVFLGFPPDAHGWQFYHPTSRRVLPSQEVTFDESVPIYCLFPYRTAPLPPPPDALLCSRSPSGRPPALSGSCSLRGVASGGAEPASAEPAGAEPEGAEPGDAESEGAESRGAEPEGAEPGGAKPEGAEPGGAEFKGAESGGAERRGTASDGGPAVSSPRVSHRREPLSPQQLREWFAQRTRLRSGAAGAGGTRAGGARATSLGGARVTVGARGTGGAGAAGPGGARTRGTRAAGAGGVGAAGAGDPGAGGTGAGDPGARGTGAGGVGAGGAGAGDPGAGGLVARGTGAGGAGATSPGGAGVTAGARGPGGAGAAGPGGARTRGTGAAGAGGVGGTGAKDPGALGTGARDPGAGGTGGGGTGTGGAGAGGAGAGGARAGGADARGAGAGGTGAGDPGAGGADAGGAGAGGAGAGGSGAGYPEAGGAGAGDPRARGAGAGGARAGDTSAGGTVQRGPFFIPPPPDSVLRQVLIPLPSPPASSLDDGLDPESDLVRAASLTVPHLLATVIIDPSFESTAASALVAELVDFAAACRLDYAASLVAESESDCPPSVGGECALGTDVLKDRQEDFEYLAAAVPRFASMLLALEGDPDAQDIPTPRSYAEAITGTYVDEVPPPGANIVDGMWIFRGVDLFHTFSPTPKMTTLRVLLHVEAQRDYKLHSLDFSTSFLQGSLHEEIWQCHPPGFTGSFPTGTQWSLRRPIYSLHQASR